MRAKKIITPEQALIRLETLCAKAEHSVAELRNKLRIWQISQQDADKIIKSLKDNRFVDDQRFAHAYANEKVKFAHWGKRKVMQGLYIKGIDRDLIMEALSDIDDDIYIANVMALIESKTKNTPSAIESYEGRNKLYHLILSRGYEPEIAIRALKEAMKGGIND